MNRSTIVILSGGLDSAVLLGWACCTRHQVRALSINYGQRHAIELDHACDIAARLGVEHRVADLSALRGFMAGSSQTSESIDVPRGHYQESMKLTVVPNRNMLLLAVAGAWAISVKADSIAYAAHAGDHAIYPDCREAFTRPFAQALKNADWHQVALEAPFITMTKTQIVQLGVKWALDDVMALSYSCYEGKRWHCGKCGTCTERREAFRLAKVSDPTTYV